MMRFAGLLGCLLVVCALSQARAEEGQGAEPWLLVDTVNLKLMVIEAGRPVRTFEGISIGRYGATRDRSRGDNRTPVGRFRIAWISDESAFHRFLGLDYPDLKTARRAYAEGRISESDWQVIRAAHRQGEVPPQDTPLGGQIGIHGIGQGSPEIHGSYNWTNGCVALTNEEMDELMQWVHIGTRVEIR
jgi:murein L,D-transpeptidase YafK